MAVRNPANPYNAGIDSNNYPTLTVVSGTAGTADVAGTAEIFAVGGNPTTGAQYIEMIGGTLNLGSITNTGTNVNIVTGSITAGTITRISTIGTLELGTMTNTGTNVNIVTGTVTFVTTVSNLTNGTVRVSVGTVGGAAASGAAASGNPNIVGGTDGGGTVYSMLVDTSGNPQVDVVTIPQVSVGTIPNVNVATGTITTGSLANIAMLHAGTVNASLVSSNGTITQVTTVSNLTNGSVNLLTGTVTRVSNVGTLESGTTQINPVPVPTMLVFGTQGTAGGSFFGTLSAASGVGTKHYVSGVDVVVESGTTDVRVLAGTSIQGTGVLAAGKFTPGGGISKRITPAFATGTNSELTYHFVGAGTAFIHIDYWRGT